MSRCATRGGVARSKARACPKSLRGSRGGVPQCRARWPSEAGLEAEAARLGPFAPRTNRSSLEGEASVMSQQTVPETTLGIASSVRRGSWVTAAPVPQDERSVINALAMNTDGAGPTPSITVEGRILSGPDDALRRAQVVEFTKHTSGDGSVGPRRRAINVAEMVAMSALTKEVMLTLYPPLGFRRFDGQRSRRRSQGECPKCVGPHAGALFRQQQTRRTRQPSPARPRTGWPSAPQELSI